MIKLDVLIVYEELFKQPTFSIVDIEKLTNNRSSSYAILARLMKAGAVKKIRSNLYSAVNFATNQVLASKYQIACAASETACISYHTASLKMTPELPTNTFIEELLQWNQIWISI